MSVTEQQPPQGISPILDIGGDVGAVVVYLAGPMGRGELDIQPEGRPERRFHTGIHLRQLGNTAAHVAVFPEVHAGRYDLIDEHGEPFASVGVDGGSVAELDLR